MSGKFVKELEIEGVRKRLKSGAANEYGIMLYLLPYAREESVVLVARNSAWPVPVVPAVQDDGRLLHAATCDGE